MQWGNGQAKPTPDGAAVGEALWREAVILRQALSEDFPHRPYHLSSSRRP